MTSQGKPIQLNDLAIFGGKPAFEQPLHVGRPNIGDRQRLHERLDDILDRRWLTNRGHYVQEFEERIAEYVGVKHAVAACNGTVALEIAIRALELTGEVIVPSFTFVATAHALSWLGIKPVFCDIDRTYSADPLRVERLITSRTTGIIGVHIFGHPCYIRMLEDIAKRFHIGILFDAAHAFGCSYSNRMIGNFGDAEVFSFHATKFFNTFEGGAITTNDDDLAARARAVKNFGFAGQDSVSCVGTNGKMSEMSAAMGLTGMESINEFISVNRGNYERYRHGLHGIPGIHVMEYDEEEENNYQYIVLEVDEAVAGMGRDELVPVLLAENVLARPYFYPIHLMEPYRSGLHLPVTERLANSTLCLPTGTAVSTQDIDRICQIIRFVLEHGEDVSLMADWKAVYHYQGN